MNEIRHQIEIEGFTPKDFFLTAPRAHPRSRERRRQLIMQHMYGAGLTPHVFKLPVVDGADGGKTASAPLKDNIMDMSKYAGSQYLKVADLKDAGPVKVKIAAVNINKKFDKPELLLSDGTILSCNVTNAGRLVRAYGAESSDWIGREIELSIGQIDFQGAPTDAILVEPISPPPENKAPVSPPPPKRGNTGGNTGGDLDDAIPF